MPPQGSSQTVSSSLQAMSLDGSSSTKSKKSSMHVADSWDDDMSDGEESNPTTPTHPQSRDGALAPDFPSAPPPTPASPHTYQVPNFAGAFKSDQVYTDYDDQSQANSSPDSRPEKTTSVANRLIAGALGVKPTRRTEEQRAYDKAARENEVKRRNLQMEAQKKQEEEREKAKRDIWDG